MEAPSPGPNQAGQTCRVADRPAVDQHQVAPNVQAKMTMREPHCLIGSSGIGHERRRCDHSMVMGVNDGPVHPRSKAEVISVDDEPAHLESLAGVFPDRSDCLTGISAVVCTQFWRDSHGYSWLWSGHRHTAKRARSGSLRSSKRLPSNPFALMFGVLAYTRKVPLAS